MHLSAIGGMQSFMTEYIGPQESSKLLRSLAFTSLVHVCLVPYGVERLERIHNTRRVMIQFLFANTPKKPTTVHVRALVPNVCPRSTRLVLECRPHRK